MTYEEFKIQVKDEISNYLSVPELKNADISLTQVIKGDKLLDGLAFDNKETQKGVLVPTLYLNGCYKAIKDGHSFEIVIKKLAELEENAFYKIDVLKKDVFPDIEKLKTDYDYAKTKLFTHVINTENNKAFLEDKPGKKIMDLTAVYKLKLHDVATVDVTNLMLKPWGVSNSQLDADALDNTQKMLPTFFPRSDVMQNMNFFVLTNKEGFYGASAMLSKEVLAKTAEMFGSSFYILPSSVNELVTVPSKYVTSVSALKAMVKGVNETQVAPEQRLSNNVYFYDDNTRELSVAHDEKETKRVTTFKSAEKAVEKREVSKLEAIKALGTRSEKNVGNVQRTVDLEKSKGER